MLLLRGFSLMELMIVVAMLMWISQTDTTAPSQDMFKQIDQKYLSANRA